MSSFLLPGRRGEKKNKIYMFVVFFGGKTARLKEKTTFHFTAIISKPLNSLLNASLYPSVPFVVKSEDPSKHVEIVRGNGLFCYYSQ